MTEALRQLHSRHVFRSGQVRKTFGLPETLAGFEAFVASEGTSAVRELCPGCPGVPEKVAAFLAENTETVWGLVTMARGVRTQADAASAKTYDEVGAELLAMVDGLVEARKALIAGAVVNLTKLAHGMGQAFSHRSAKAELTFQGLNVADNYLMPIWERAVESAYPEAEQKADKARDPALFQHKAAVAVANATKAAEEAWEDWVFDFVRATARSATSIVSPRKKKATAGLVFVAGLGLAALLALLL